MRMPQAIVSAVCVFAVAVAPVLLIPAAQASVGCPTWGCIGSTPKPPPTNPSTPGTGTGSPGSGSGDDEGGSLRERYTSGVAWFNSNWYPGSPSGELPPGAAPIYYGKYDACGGRFTAYDGDWLGYTWSATWMIRSKYGDAVAPRVSYSCIRPPAYTERTVFCVETYDGFQQGPYSNAIVEPVRIQIDRSRTPFAKSQSPRDCVQSTFGVQGVESMDWGLWQLTLNLTGKQCTLRQFTTADAQTGRVPESQLRGCTTRTQTGSAVMAVWCAKSGGDLGRRVYGNSSLSGNQSQFIPSGVTFTANDCGSAIAAKPDQCVTGYPTQITPEGTRIKHGPGNVVEVLNQGFTSSGTHRFTWKPPSPRIWDPLKSGWAEEDKSVREVLTSVFDVPDSSSPRLAGRPLPSDYAKDQPFKGSPIAFGKRAPGPSGNFSISAAWKEATQKSNGTWQIVPTWDLLLSVKLTQYEPTGWDLALGGPTTGSVGYRWHDVKLTCQADPATVVVKRTIVR